MHYRLLPIICALFLTALVACDGVETNVPPPRRQSLTLSPPVVPACKVIADKSGNCILRCDPGSDNKLAWLWPDDAATAFTLQAVNGICRVSAQAQLCPAQTVNRADVLWTYPGPNTFGY